METTMGLNPDQLAAEAAFADFKKSDDTLFALLGYAGTGKSFTEAHLLKNHILESGPEQRGFVNPFMSARGEVLIAAPTHKAINVSRRFFDEIGIKYELGYDKFYHAYGTPITGSTAQVLGIRPVITDDQTAKKMNFGKVDRGLIEKVGDVNWIVVDEFSMLSQPHLDDMVEVAKAIGAKILLVGDPGQLPPVEAIPIDVDAIENKAILTQIMRQQGDSAIPHLASAVREGRDWTAIEGPGVDHFKNPAGAFIDEIDGPPAADERDRAVFIAYRNARVNAVQQAACQKIYGHGRLEIGPNEVLVASTPLMDQRARVPTALCNNGDVLTVLEVLDRGAWGTEVRLRRESTGEIHTEFLNEAEMGDPTHPYNVELKTRELLARKLQSEFNNGNPSQRASVDPARRAAWAGFFELKNSTVLSASHVFAITSHKSQGSTYKSAFVDAADMADFDHRALYVGATRPSEELIIG
jgi:hypothetical protein